MRKLTMKTKNTGIALLTITLVLFATYSCVEPYAPKVADSQANFLVVDGFIDIAGESKIRLSRTTSISNLQQSPIEMNATVTVEEQDGNTYQLFESVPGNYTANLLPLDPAKLVRLRISTILGEQIESDFVPIKISQPIDSVNWTTEDDHLDLYVNTHDDSKQSQYYLWEYDVTWSYHSQYFSTVEWQPDGTVNQRPLGEDIFHCYRTVPSTQILIGSSTTLSEDRISNYVLLEEPLNSEKFQDKASFLVTQYVLTSQGYDYWQALKKNTENLGTVFGTLPSQIISNIRDVNSPDRQVLGYFSAGTSQQKRIFIKIQELPPIRHITGYETCESDTLLKDDLQYFHGGSSLITEVFIGTTFIGWSRSDNYCVDCRNRGGVIDKPLFWPN